MTRAWQIIQTADEYFEYAEISRNALFAINLIQLSRKGISVGEMKANLIAEVDKAIILLKELGEDFDGVMSGHVKHLYSVGLLQKELSLDEPKVLRNKILEAFEELKEFVEGKRNNVENASEILEIISSASRKVVHESLESLVFP
ncbi:MAG: hypothetical protein H5T50_06785 [Nitrososphaeria archaeon]|nr:hypothetical protein [Nitrososphaeria archaeon]